jgi:hypothetical protein
VDPGSAIRIYGDQGGTAGKGTWRGVGDGGR